MAWTSSAACLPSRAILQGTPEALPSHILRHLSSLNARRAEPHYAWLQAAREGLVHRAGDAAHAHYRMMLVRRHTHVQRRATVTSSNPRHVPRS